MFAYDRAAPWYINPVTGQWEQAEKREEGYITPRVDEETNWQQVDLSNPENEMLLGQRLTELLGYDPNNKRVNADGSVSVFNPASNSYEIGVNTASGNSAPLSIARASGDPILQQMMEPKESGGGVFGQVKDMWGEGAFSVPLMAFGPMAGKWLGGATGLGPTAGQAIFSAGKSALSGENPLMGAAMSLGGSYAMDAFKPTASVTDGANPTAVNSFNVSKSMPGFYDELIGLDTDMTGFRTEGINWGGGGDSDLSWMQDPNYGFVDYGSDDWMNQMGGGPVANDEWNRLVSGITGRTVDLGNSDYMVPTSGGNPMFSNGSGLVKALASLAAAGGAQSGTAANALKSVLGGGGSLGGNILGQLSDNPLQAAFNSTPFLLALYEANRQGGDIDGTLNELRGLIDGAGSGVEGAVLNPYDRETALGRGRLTQSLSDRGVLGSSFGTADLTNYDTLRDTGRGDLLAKTKLGTTALKSDLFSKVLQGQTQKNTNRNLLLGAGLSASGNLFKPAQDPFNLRALMGA